MSLKTVLLPAIMTSGKMKNIPEAFLLHANHTVIYKFRYLRKISNFDETGFENWAW